MRLVRKNISEMTYFVGHKTLTQTHATAGQCVCDIMSAGFLSIVRWLCRHIIYCGLTLMSWSTVSLTAHQQLSAQRCWTATSSKSLAGTWQSIMNDGQLTQSCFFLLCFNSHLPLTTVRQVHLDVAYNSAYMYCSYPSTLFDC